MAQSAEVDFRNVCRAEKGFAAKSVCTTSLCGRYFLLADGTEIYTYDIQGHSPRLIDRTVCEKRVLAIAIDASPHRFAIAALLESRIGVYIDLLGTPSSEPAASQ